MKSGRNLFASVCYSKFSHSALGALGALVVMCCLAQFLFLPAASAAPADERDALTDRNELLHPPPSQDPPDIVRPA